MTSAESSLGFQLADISRLMRKAFQQQLTGSELTPAQARALIYLSRHQGIRQVELAEYLNVQPITLARQLDQLEKEGLIERRPDPADRRAHRLYPLPAADNHLACVQKVATEIKAMALAGLSDEEVTHVMAALDKIRSNLLLQTQ